MLSGGGKADKTRIRILTIAEELFIAKGFYAVTMIELCQRAGLSRGGLYRYFSSTADVLRNVILKKSADVAEAYDAMLAQRLSPDQMLDNMLLPKLEDLAKMRGTIDNAVVEYLSGGHGDADFAWKHAEEHVAVIANIIELGQASGDYIEADSHKLARMILWQIEGMKAYCTFHGFTHKELEDQLILFKQCLRKCNL